MKKCKFYAVCGFEAQRENFPAYVKSSNGKTYYRNMCSPCFKQWNNEKSRISYEKDKSNDLQKRKERRQNPIIKNRIKNYMKNYRKNNSDKIKLQRDANVRTPIGRFKHAKRSTKNRGMLWELTFDEFIDISSKPCYYCGNVLCPPIATGINLDRLDSSKGYKMDNVVACGVVCNTIKMHFFTPEETKIAIQAILAFRSKNSSQFPKEPHHILVDKI